MRAKIIPVSKFRQRPYKTAVLTASLSLRADNDDEYWAEPPKSGLAFRLSRAIVD
jgi:hypothetical protein